MRRPTVRRVEPSRWSLGVQHFQQSCDERALIGFLSSSRGDDGERAGLGFRQHVRDTAGDRAGKVAAAVTRPAGVQQHDDAPPRASEEPRREFGRRHGVARARTTHTRCRCLVGHEPVTVVGVAVTAPDQQDVTVLGHGPKPVGKSGPQALRRPRSQRCVVDHSRSWPQVACMMGDSVHQRPRLRERRPLRVLAAPDEDDACGSHDEPCLRTQRKQSGSRTLGRRAWSVLACGRRSRGRGPDRDLGQLRGSGHPLASSGL